MSRSGIKIKLKFRYISKMNLANAKCIERCNSLEVVDQINIRVVSGEDLSIW